jgi:ribonuclease P protein subunit POP4
MRTRANLGRHELIGLEVEVLDATDKARIGTKGTLVDETRNMLTIKMTLKNSTEKEVRIQKKGTKVRVKLEDGPDGRSSMADLDCDKIMFRPEDRIKRVRK